MIPIATWMVLKRLRRKGFEAYLVGGCVRDLLSKRIPKDFDVITTAQLKQIHQIFHRSNIVGHRFPICLVNVRGSLVEVSSFDTAAKHGKQNDSNHLPTLLGDFDKKDFVRWRNSMDRDFTINSLFFDPFVDKIYDYNNGIRDLRLRKVKTVSPAQSSFEEDCARILRGLRIAARLGLTFSKETAAAIQNLYLSIMDLSKNRLMMELNYMLSYGAAESSIRLLKRYKVLDILLPVHAAYLNQQIHRESTQSSYMLLKLFSCVDKLLACDRPSHCSLWVGLLAFHLALVNKPQDALVVWAFSSVLYHGKWNKAVEFARKQADMPVKFSPEILEGSLTISDNDLAEEVTCFVSHVVSSISSLTKEESLLESMNKYFALPMSGCGTCIQRGGSDCC
ncbi:hypothetical protein Syun_005599 [Stephania yunnanensis]|uniref:Poly(A) polymerase n=1 Tax=Stephania yunnanensis TaxID=152371 RepID=A0AAP0L502_9MAGN